MLLIKILWPLGIAAEALAFYFLFDGPGDVGAVDMINRGVGGSFIACGLIVWRRNPETRTGALMTATGFLFLLDPLLSEADDDLAYTIGQVFANYWVFTFVALVLAFPSGRLTRRVDQLIVALFFLSEGLLQPVWLFFLQFPPGKSNLLLVDANESVADVIDHFQRSLDVVLCFAIVVVVARRWKLAPRLARSLLLPAVAGAATTLVLGAYVAITLALDQPSRTTQTVSGLALLLVPLAFLAGSLRAQLARGAMADLLRELRRAPVYDLDEPLARALGDPSLVVGLWAPERAAYVTADDVSVDLPAEGSSRVATLIDHDERRIAVLVHDEALTYFPELLEAACAAAELAIEHDHLETELTARVAELEGSRARIVEAGDAARRRIERDLHDGAQQRLVSLALDLRLAETRIADDPDAAVAMLAEARGRLGESLDELRELARGIHPTVLDLGLHAGLEALASRSPIPVTLEVTLTDRLSKRTEIAGYFVASEALANAAKHAQAKAVTIRFHERGGEAVLEVADDGVGGAHDNGGSGIQGLFDRVGAVGGSLRVSSPAGEGTVVRAAMALERV